MSKEISVMQELELKESPYLKELGKYRQDIKWLENLKYSNISDTIFILESIGIQGDFRFTVWNQNDIISYSNETGQNQVIKRKLFTEYMMQLVANWNLSQIRIEEVGNANFTPNDIIYATKIVILNNEYTISCISFRDFFNLERDVDQ